MPKQKTLEELKKWESNISPVAFGAAGYDISKDYKNGQYTGDGERDFLQHFYNKWGK